MIPAVLPPPATTNRADRRGADGSTDTDFDEVLAHVGLDSTSTRDDEIRPDDDSDRAPGALGPHRPGHHPLERPEEDIEDTDAPDPDRDQDGSTAAAETMVPALREADHPSAGDAGAPVPTDLPAGQPTEGGEEMPDGTTTAGTTTSAPATAAAGPPSSPAPPASTPPAAAVARDAEDPASAAPPDAEIAGVEVTSTEPGEVAADTDAELVDPSETAGDAGSADADGSADTEAETADRPQTTDGVETAGEPETTDRAQTADGTETDGETPGDEAAEAEPALATERNAPTARGRKPAANDGPTGPPGAPPASDAAREAPGVSRVSERGLADLPFVDVPDQPPTEAAPTTAPAGGPAPTATPATAPTAPTPAAPAPPPAVVDQLVEHVSPLLDGPDGTHELSIELRPAELGRVVLEVSLDDGVVHVKVHADDTVSRRLLADALPDLRQALERGGVRAGNLDVGNGSWERSGDRAHGDDRPGRGDHRPPPRRRPDPAPTRPLQRDVALDVLL